LSTFTKWLPSHDLRPSDATGELENRPLASPFLKLRASSGKRFLAFPLFALFSPPTTFFAASAVADLAGRNRFSALLGLLSP
jgi:hypothetical protein